MASTDQMALSPSDDAQIVDDPVTGSSNILSESKLRQELEKAHKELSQYVEKDYNTMTRLADSESKNDELTAQIEYLWEIIREGRGFGSSQLEKAISYHKDLEKKYQQKELKWKKMLKNQDVRISELECERKSLYFEKEKVLRSKEELLTRLSKLAGSKLTQNNPGITDLSDSNRESKLAEQLSELYDTEWTDAFEELTESGLSDNEAIFVILDILKSAYSFCCNIAEKYETGLFKSPSHLPVLEVIQHRVPDIQVNPEIEISDEIKYQLEDIRKTVSPLFCESVQKWLCNSF